MSRSINHHKRKTKQMISCGQELHGIKLEIFIFLLSSIIKNISFSLKVHNHRHYGSADLILGMLKIYTKSIKTMLNQPEKIGTNINVSYIPFQQQYV